MAYAQPESVGPPDMPQGTPAEFYPQQKQGRSCWFYGCLVLIILGVIGILVTAAGVYVAIYYFNRFIEEYTATAPLELPPAKFSDDERKAIDERWKTFQEAVDKGEEAELVLTAADLNAMISEVDAIKGTINVSIDGSEVGGKISYPLERTGIWGTKGRYLNGNATFTVSLEDGELEAYLKSIEINGKKAPDEAMTEFSKQNLLKDTKFDDETRAKLRRIESLTVKDGKVYLKSKPKKSKDADQPKPNDEPKKDAPTPPPTEEPKKEAPTPPADAPKPEAPPADAPKVEAPPAEPPKAETPAAEPPKVETPPAEVPKAA